MDNVIGLFLKLVNNLETPVFLVSYPDLCLIAFNDASDRQLISPLLGREINEDKLIGKTTDEIFLDPGFASELRDLIYRAGSEKNTVRQNNIQLTDYHGGISIFDMLCFPLENDNGSVRYVVGSAVDVTHRSKIAQQEKLISTFRKDLKSRELLQSILNILPFGVLFYNKNKTLKYLNETFYWLSGYQREELLGLSREEAEKIFLDAGGGGCRSDENIISDDNLHLITKYNDTKLVELYNIPLVKAGFTDGVVTVVSEKNSGSGPLFSGATIQAVLESISSSVLITDRDFYVVACNREFLELSELEEHQVTEQTIQKILGMLNFQSGDIAYQDIKYKKVPYKFQATITTKSEKKKVLSINNKPLLNMRGRFDGIVSVITDITSFIEKQENLIENERLAVIGQLTSGIAHEIKNPLTVISGFAEVTKSKILKLSGNDSLKESMLYYQQEIIENCRQMNKLIIDLLQLARPKKTEKVRVNLAGTLDKICNSLSPYALQRNVTLLKNLAAAELDMEIDPVQIGQVLLNLCNNAIQAMPDGGVLNISTRRNGHYLIIEVSDTGSGIKPEDLGKLGTPFFTTKAEGTGLGLSVTYSIVRDYGGKIEVESQEGKGSVFRVFLPVSQLE